MIAAGAAGTAAQLGNRTIWPKEVSNECSGSDWKQSEVNDVRGSANLFGPVRVILGLHYSSLLRLSRPPYI